MLRKFSCLKQTGMVLEYAEQFNLVMHSLLAHHSSWDPLFFTTQFLDGLQYDIKAAVMLHRLQDLETVVALAELQEEAVAMLQQEHTSGEHGEQGATIFFPTAIFAAMAMPAVTNKTSGSSLPSPMAVEGHRSPDPSKGGGVCIFFHR